MVLSVLDVGYLLHILLKACIGCFIVYAKNLIYIGNYIYTPNAIV